MTQVCAQALDKQRRELDLPNDGVAQDAHDHWQVWHSTKEERA